MMSSLQLLLLSTFLGSFAFASPAPTATFSCKVQNYDKQYVDLSCANVDKPVVMRTPTSWIPPKQKLARDAKIKLSLTFDQIEQWPSFANNTADQK